MNLVMIILQNITSNSNNKDKEDNINIQEATIISNNITQQGLNINNTITETINEDIKPDYGAIATSAAITGAIAGAMITMSQVMENYTGTQQTSDTASGSSVYKNDPSLYEPGGALYGQKPVGVIDSSVQNMGSSHLTGDVNLVGKPVIGSISTDPIYGGSIINPVTVSTANIPWHMESSWFMGPIEANVPGMHNLSIFHDMWGTPNNNLGSILGAVGPNQISIFLPALPLNYCMLYPSACAGIIGSQANKPKPQNQNSSIIINKR